jgi:hypothetical protein
MIKGDSEDFIKFVDEIQAAEQRANKVLIETPAGDLEVFRKQTKGQLDDIAIKLVNKANTFVPKELESSYKNGEMETDKEIKRAAGKQHTAPLMAAPRGQIANTYIELAGNIKIASQNAINIVNNSIKAVQDSGRLATVSMVRDEIKKTMLAENGNAMNVTYSNGKKVALSGYSEMLARTSRISTENEGLIDRTQQMGRDLVICTEINSTCAICRKFEGKVYSISGESKKFPPLYTGANAPFAKGYNIIHPNCRHEFLPFIEEMYTEKKLADLEKKSNHFVNYTGKEKIFAAYRERQSKLRQYREELREYNQMKAEFGKNMPYETLGGFRRAKRADSKLFAVEEQKLRMTLKSAEIRSDAYNKTIHIGRQGKHIVGHNNYIQGKSIVTIPPNEIQAIVNKTAGTGEPQYSGNKFTNRELIVYANIVGKTNNFKGELVDTNRFYIYYSKSGTHIVPTLKGADNE